MNKLSLPWKAVRTILLAFLLLVVIIPLLFFFATSFYSSAEMGNFPKKMIPTFSVKIKVEAVIDETTDTYNGRYRIYYDSGSGYQAILTTGKASQLEDVLSRYSITKSGEKLLEDFKRTEIDGPTIFTYNKDLLYNFKVFFEIAPRALKGLYNSIIASLLTILISLSIGSMAGFAIARYQFKFKEQINILLLLVRMFPLVGISIPMAVLMIKFNLFDSLLGLAILYSIPNIALTSWITSSIFIGINKELEEASLVFGATQFKTFMHITLPLALPALAACSMYAFLAAWNDTISALILTRENQTLALVVYKAIGSTADGMNFAAAGSIILVIPALVFTFIIRKYVGQMWGGVKL
jgi:multiple sugar transport system permease protein